ncbi:transcription-repair coupling factor [Desulfobacter postgatei]|uniref:Transcription-repair-coupling factor n=1 Tax=Desulfobacter postgatei 2ac9 TaxID=879212 RepID=I5B2P2_9BACT|nr:transcription-repair coupling factor [Desulfobacter postgatei]EIM63755.1 transcription-repair coupling factor Mfd [Desulfobacter postgatei 2ac9]
MIDAILNSLKKSKHTMLAMNDSYAPKAWMIAQLFPRLNQPLVVVLPDAKKAAAFISDLQFFMSTDRQRIIFFPGSHYPGAKNISFHKDTSASRVAALFSISERFRDRFLLVTYLEPLLSFLMPPEVMTNSFELVMANEEIDRNGLLENLEASGYTRATLVEDPGEYAVRGGIVDIFSPGLKQPVRLEFFGDFVESIRHFSPYTQRGTKELVETIIIPATEAVITKQSLPHVQARLRGAGNKAGLTQDRIREYVNQIRDKGRFDGIESMLPIVYDSLATLFDYLPENTFFILDDADVLPEKAKDFHDGLRLNFNALADEKRLSLPPESICPDWQSVEEKIFASKTLCFKALVLEQDKSKADILSLKCSDNRALSESLRNRTKDATPLTPLVEWIEQQQRDVKYILFVLSQDAQARRLTALLTPYGIEPQFCRDFSSLFDTKPGIYFTVGALSCGFVPDLENFSIVTEDEIFGRKRIRRRVSGKRDLKAEFIAPEELKNGDFVVHLEHGVGRYEGLFSLTVSGITQDFILVVYQDDDKLYVPVDRMEVIGKYIGVDGYTPVLDKIGSKSWTNSKAKARAEVEKMAADLLDLYARRKVAKGFSFSRPDNYYNDFEAGFPYEETRDQLRAIDDVHLDMEKDTPMDRLVCGDVGYGKTEVAIRAAFKAVNDGKQVALVVPTTILAEQHLNTFRDRFNNYPVIIECLSRFRTRKEQTDILKRTAGGTVDIVIGTHRLLQKDVVFKSLGLLIIDEEQRFGVKHKEKLKEKRAAVDVLALSATPIPRTLHMSLTGMRDISVITTPPADRRPIISYITKYEEPLVREAVIKELDRKGQVFFVHNNIKTIFKTAENIQKLIPDAKIGVAHGRLSETELEKVMEQFIRQQINVLVCTTIIESGLDIPSANTMIIDKAERFGLSQIYQLRGRIGRGDEQAYAYLFIEDESRLTKDARKRLAALMEHRDLGSGFQIAMKDLQIRGAGTALGASQSGHIAAVGYDMFLKLLDNAVKDMKGEHLPEPLEPEINASMSSGFPDDYIESVEQRLTIYRRLSRLTQVSDIAEMKKELVDRYGELPKSAENMLLKIMLRIFAIKAGVKRLDVTPDVLVLEFSPDHMNRTLTDIESVLKKTVDAKFVKKTSVRIQLGHKRSNISRALLETKQILSSIFNV